MAIENDDVIMENFRVNGSRGSVSLTNYSSRGIRIAGGRQRVTLRNIDFHDLPGTPSNEGFALTTSGMTEADPITDLHIENIDCWDMDTSCISVAGDYEGNRSTYDFTVRSISCRNVGIMCVTIYGARDGVVESVFAVATVSTCVNVEFSQNVQVDGSTCKDGSRGATIRGDCRNIQIRNSTFSNNTGGNSAELEVLSTQWWTGDALVSTAHDVIFKNVTVMPRPGNYYLYIDRSGSMSSYTETGLTISINQTNGTITRSAGSWDTKLNSGAFIKLGGFANAANNVEVQVIRTSNTVLSYTPASFALITESGTGDESYVDTFELYPAEVVIDSGDAYKWTLRTLDVGGTARTDRIIPVMKYRGFNLGETIYVGSLLKWLPGASASVAAYAGSGNLDNNAVTVTSTAINNGINSAYIMQPRSRYLLKVRAKPTSADAGELWGVLGSDGATLPIFMTPSGNAALNTNQWLEGEVILTTGLTNWARVQIQLATSVASSTLDIDQISLYRIADGDAGAGSQGILPFRIEGWVISGTQNPVLGVLPGDCATTNLVLNVTEAFNSSGTDLLTAGYDADVDSLLLSTDVSTTGLKVIGGLVPGSGVSASGIGVGNSGSARQIELYYTAGGSAPTTGKAWVGIECLPATVQP